jgi:hypothetical protein
MILFAILTFIIFISAKRVDLISDWTKRVVSKPYNYLVLLTLLVIGFFGRLDYTNRWGCFVGGEPVFDLKNITFSSISISLILLSFLLKHRNLKLSLVLIELVFWIFKLFYFKGGYVCSITATPDPIISFYDCVTLAFRLFIVAGLLKSNFKAYYILLCTLIIIAIKAFGFPTQFSLITEEKKSLRSVELTKEKLIGEWIGTCEYDSIGVNGIKQLIDTATFRFYTNTVTLIDFQDIDSVQLFVDFYSEYWGYFHERKNDNWENYYDFWIKNISSDSLELILIHTLDDNRFKMRLKRHPTMGIANRAEI